MYVNQLSVMEQKRIKKDLKDYFVYIGLDTEEIAEAIEIGMESKLSDLSDVIDIKPSKRYRVIDICGEDDEFLDIEDIKEKLLIAWGEDSEQKFLDSINDTTNIRVLQQMLEGIGYEILVN